MAYIETVNFRLSTGQLVEVNSGGYSDGWGYGWKCVEGVVSLTIDVRKEIDDCLNRGLKIIREG